MKPDGTVVAVGNNSYGQLNVSSWTDIVQISAGGWHTVGVKSDGTALAVGHNSYGQCDVSSWTDIMQVSAGTFHTVGLKSDGTVVAVGRNDYGQCDVFSWDLLENQPPLADANEDQIVSGDYSGKVIVWDVASQEPLITLTDGEQRIMSVDWSSDGRRIAVGKEDGMIQIWTLPGSD